MKARWIGITLGTVATLALVACEKKEESATSDAATSGSAHTSAAGSAHTATADAGHATGSASAGPTASGSATPSTGAAAAPWYATAPAKATTAKAGDVAWVLHPYSGNGAWLNPMEVVSVTGNTATVRDLALMASGADAWKLKPEANGKTYAGVPGSVVIPARAADVVKPKAGDIVWAGVTNAPAPWLAKVEKVDGGLVVYNKLNATMKELDKDQKAEYVEPYGSGVAPFAYVAQKSGDGYKLILVLAVDGDNVYGRSGDAFVTAKKSDVKALKAAWKDRKKGDNVLAFSTGGDGKVSKIDTVPMEKWVYKIGPSEYPWTMVFDAP